MKDATETLHRVWLELTSGGYEPYIEHENQCGVACYGGRADCCTVCASLQVMVDAGFAEIVRDGHRFRYEWRISGAS